MRAAVTGGAGFIGSNLVDALLDAGAEVLAIDDLSTGRRRNLEGALARGAALAERDITDAPGLDEAIDGFGPDRIFHLAAQADVRKAVADPAFDATVNVLGTINVLEAARRHDAPVVFASTGGAIYGEGEGRELPFAEEAPSLPETAYGASKLSGEVYLGLYRRLHGLAAVALRFGNVYGPRQDPHGEAGVVAIFCGLLRAGRPLRVFGDGEQTRDYIYVDDVVAAFLAAERVLGRDGTGVEGPFNVGTGIETSVLDLARRLAVATGAESEIEHHPARTGEVQRVAIDPAAAGRDLDWAPATDLDAGLASTAAALGDAG
ncbi:MAG TPA: NAD-dependent epimerase/dehydratase family protein [Solirubrobacterales bacterium]|nr:NAD-dependent epimerase/dehydratase family protein [Solirubrobacterales bacterium]